ncbi:MAG TPA: hypothetical protein VMT61_10730 [Candidatus Binataceae bacterium]|nr:hypothetical protein [Candidatus Binataceae bacterium]
MTPAEKGLHYAKLFRKAGALLAKGRIARAVAAFEEGRAFAEAEGDRAMVKRFAAEIESAKNTSSESG